MQAENDYIHSSQHLWKKWYLVSMEDANRGEEDDTVVNLLGERQTGQRRGWTAGGMVTGDDVQ